MKKISKHYLRLFTTLGLGVSLSVGLSACSSLSWLNPFSKPDPSTLPMPLVEFKPAMPVQKVWSHSIGGTSGYVFSPVIVGDGVIAASEDGNVYKFNVETGKSIWRARAESSLTSGVGANEDTVAVVGNKALLQVFDGQGQRKWTSQLTSEVIAAPLVANNLVLIQSMDNRISAFDAKTGEKKWTIERNLPILTLRLLNGMVHHDNHLIAANSGGKLASIALNNGGLKWEASLGEPKGATELERIVDAAGVPSVSAGLVCSASYQGNTACFDVKTGAMKWAKPLSSEFGLATDERFVFAVDNQSALYAYAIGNGASMWKNDKLLRRGLSRPLSFERAVVVGDKLGYLHFLSREDGEMLARINVDSSAIQSAPVYRGNTLIVQTKSGSLTAIRLANVQ